MKEQGLRGFTTKKNALNALLHGGLTAREILEDQDMPLTVEIIERGTLPMRSDAERSVRQHHDKEQFWMNLHETLKERIDNPELMDMILRGRAKIVRANACRQAAVG